MPKKGEELSRGQFLSQKPDEMPGDSPSKPHQQGRKGADSRPLPQSRGGTSGAWLVLGCLSVFNNQPVLGVLEDYVKA